MKNIIGLVGLILLLMSGSIAFASDVIIYNASWGLGNKSFLVSIGTNAIQKLRKSEYLVINLPDGEYILHCELVGDIGDDIKYKFEVDEDDVYIRIKGRTFWLNKAERVSELPEAFHSNYTLIKHQFSQ